MAHTNVPRKAPSRTTHEGAPARSISPEQELRRSLMACLLWEDTFYESGVEIAQRLAGLVKQVPVEKVAAMALEARGIMNLRHAPLLIAREMARSYRKSPLVKETIAAVIQRTDELAEFVSLYWKEGRQPLSSQVKKGLAMAFRKFDEYGLAKYNRDNAVKLRDVLFLCHAKPKDEAQDALWKRLIADQLAVPDTWETQLSAGKDKHATWVRLIEEGKLGGLALLRNLRNMQEAGVSRDVIRGAIGGMRTERILPFRFVAAARYAPWAEPELENAMFLSTQALGKLEREVTILVDVSGSMDSALSEKSDMTRIDAACALAMILREVCKTVNVYSFSAATVAIAPRRGFALRDAIVTSQRHASTMLGHGVLDVRSAHPSALLVVVTDEQSHDAVPNPGPGGGYLINTAAYQHGVGYGPWVHVDGFSEGVVRYILEREHDGQAAR